MNTYQIKSLTDDTKIDTITDYMNLGNSADCQLQITDSAIEDRHCRLEIKNNSLFIKDLRSRQGTWVNGAKIIEAELQDGDIITLGSLDFVIIKSDNSSPTLWPLSSKNTHLQNEYIKAHHMAQSDHSVLLLGSSGVGKDVIARTIHQFSKRKNGPFISVNCSALTETLVESELFGHIKGSFTGAIADRKGAFEAARGGTLFLDEIGDLSYNLQAKILRALENEEIRPVGADKIVKTNVRIIAATHKNLNEKIIEGSFRQDLFFRLNVLTLQLPNLADRKEDFEDLLYHFAKAYKVRFSHNAIQKLKKHDWPGNIRELKNTVIKASVVFPKEHIQESHIIQIVDDKKYSSHNSLDIPLKSNSSVIKEIEKQMIIKRLLANNGSQKKTAVDLGLPKSTLHDRIKTYGINLEQFKN